MYIVCEQPRGTGTTIRAGGGSSLTCRSSNWLHCTLDRIQQSTNVQRLICMCLLSYSSYTCCRLAFQLRCLFVCQIYIYLYTHTSIYIYLVCIYVYVYQFYVCQFSVLECICIWRELCVKQAKGKEREGQGIGDLLATKYFQFYLTWQGHSKLRRFFPLFFFTYLPACPIPL